MYSLVSTWRGKQEEQKGSEFAFLAILEGILFMLRACANFDVQFTGGSGLIFGAYFHFVYYNCLWGTLG